ncbi:glycoside hydrolase family 39 protein [Armillaria luteobubalina]|uniref:Glycoside hydrolase family 39 protein n=1 Tax=Armillaria luteobubalina TaxID=153913 RepID=A0AA39Q213_9AGAR|nr:glycoside hydrolase family 39 protein [Armillaria luteobubalina]
MFRLATVLLLFASLSYGGAAVFEPGHVWKRQSSSQITTVDLSTNLGTPLHLASGFIYGIPDTPNQIPDHFYTEMGFNYARAGGAQVLSPGRGWIFGEYPGRFASVLSNYQTTRKYGAEFIFLLHDLWGADGSQGSSASYPGDNGNWTDFDNYLTQLISDIRANNMTPGLKMDIWNEPDLTIFWNRPQSQWLATWDRTYNRLRSELPSVPLFGPTLAGAPSTSNTWWTNFFQQVTSSGTIPDAYVWHLEGSTTDVNDDLQTNIPILNQLLSQFSLPQKQIIINEYGVFAEQNPAGAAWWIARLERYNVPGLRGNWLSTTQLHDFLASLLGKTDVNDATGTGYWPNGEWQVYKYYNTNMTGHRVSSSGSIDRLADSYAVVGSDRVRILVGNRQTTGTWQLTINNLASVGLPQSGTLPVNTFQFSFMGGHFGQVGDPTDLGWVNHAYSGNSVSFPIFQTDTQTTWAFEFEI